MKSRSQIHNVFLMSILWRQILNVAQTLPRRWIVNSFHSISQMLKWQLRYNVESTTSNLQRLLDVCITTLYLRCFKFAKDIKCGLFMATFPQPCLEIIRTLIRTWRLSTTQGQCCNIRLLFLPHTLKIAFERFRDIMIRWSHPAWNFAKRTSPRQIFRAF